MDSIKFLITFFFKVAIGALFIAIVWWLVALLFPAISISQLRQLTTTEGEVKKDFLPSPRAYSGLFKPVVAPSATSNVYVHGKEFNGFNLSEEEMSNSSSFLSYTDGSKPVSATHPAPTAAPSRSTYIRNLSIYENGPAYYGLSFFGEARNEMFRNGAFPVLVIDQRGVVIGVSRASSTGAWSVPGWSRFTVSINHTIPPGGRPCSIVFEQGRIQNQNSWSGQSQEASQPVRVGIPVRCN
jgi:hypothetical protein